MPNGQRSTLPLITVALMVPQEDRQSERVNLMMRAVLHQVLAAWRDAASTANSCVLWRHICHRSHVVDDLVRCHALADWADD